MKTFIRYFFNPIEQREDFLNKKAKEGYELVSSGTFIHKFKKSKNIDYRYAVEYIGYMNSKERLEYKNFLEEMGMKVLYSPFNILKLSMGNVKLRLYNKPSSVMSTLPGMINNEIVIIQKKGLEDFKSFTDMNSIRKDFNRRRIINVYALLISIVLIGIGVAKKMGSHQNLTMTWISFRPLEKYPLLWILIGGVFLIFSAINILRIEKLLNNIKTKGIKNTLK